MATSESRRPSADALNAANGRARCWAEAAENGAVAAAATTTTVASRVGYTLTKSKQLMRLKTEPPLRVFQTVADRVSSVLLDLRPVHGLKKEVCEVEPFITKRI